MTFTPLQMARYRADVVGSLRSVLESIGSVEVMTPVLSRFPDLAPMPQFQTTHPHTGAAYCLRIAPEEHLTRLIAAGIPAVFEFAKNFRCEIVDETHLIEFLALEALFADTPLISTLDIMSQLLSEICRTAARLGFTPPSGLGQEHFPRIDLPDFVEAEYSFAPDDFWDDGALGSLAAGLGYRTDVFDRSSAVDFVIGTIAREIGGPAFIGIFPSYLGGPAGRNATRPNFIDRYELYFDGIELGSVAEQLRDAGDWEQRYAVNGEIKATRGIEPILVNDELLKDLRTGLPQFSGLGLGLERAMALASGVADVRQLQLFLVD